MSANIIEYEGKAYHIHPMTAGQYRRINAYIKQGVDVVAADFMVLHHCVKDEHGNPTYPTAQDAENISPKEFAALFPACLDVNGVGDEEQKKSHSEATKPN